MHADVDDAWIRFLLAEDLPSPIANALRASLAWHGIDRALALCVVAHELADAFGLDDDEIEALLGVARVRAATPVLAFTAITAIPAITAISGARGDRRARSAGLQEESAPWPAATRRTAHVKGGRG